MYDLKWNSDHPGHVVFLIDLSGSMELDNKINYVIDAVQDSIENLLTHCRNDKGLPAERVSVSVYGYNYHIITLWKNYGLSQMASAMLDAEEAGKKIFDPNGDAKPEYQTCMKLAFEEAKKDVEQWIQSQQGKLMYRRLLLSMSPMAIRMKGRSTIKSEYILIRSKLLKN